MKTAHSRRILTTASAILIALGATTGLHTAFASPDSHGTPSKTTKTSKSSAKPTETKTTETKTTETKPTSKHSENKSTDSHKSAKTGKPAEPTVIDNGKTDEHAEAGDEHSDANGNHGAAHGASPSTSEHGNAAGASAHGEAHTAPAPGGSNTTYTPDQALSMLVEGNARWVSGNPTSPNTDASRRSQTAQNGQFPFVTVITCADSRCPVERIFDRGVGDVFVARVAGNVVDTNTAGTVEYGVEHLHTPVIVVMGHTACGAVKAACAGAKPGHNIDALLSEISPAVARAKTLNPNAQGDEFINIAIRENVFQSIFDLLNTSPMTAKFVQEKKVKLVGAVYDISTGKVEFLGEHPWQDQLIQATLPRANPTSHETAGAEEHSGH